MIPRFFSIERVGAGTLSIMARPGVGEIEAMAQIGIGALVSLLPAHQAADAGLADEADRAAEAGVAFLHFPIDDFGVPDGPADEEIAWIRQRLDAGEHVVVHCLGGVGRSSTIAAAVLVDEGVAGDVAWERIEDSRGRRVPETDAQRQWVAARRR